MTSKQYHRISNSYLSAGGQPTMVPDVLKLPLAYNWLNFPCQNSDLPSAEVWHLKCDYEVQKRRNSLKKSH